MAGNQVFRLEKEFDREHAEGTGGRFAEHVRRRADEFAEAYGDISPVGFACVAWRLAVPPSLSPGFVRWHRRVLSAGCLRNEWDGSLTARVELVGGLPESLARSRHWWRDRGWRGWPELFGQFVRPTHRDLATAPHLRATLLMEAPLPLGGLPPAPDGPDDELAGLARRAVVALVRELNELLNPIVAQLDSGDPGGRGRQQRADAR